MGYDETMCELCKTGYAVYAVSSHDLPPTLRVSGTVWICDKCHRQYFPEKHR